MQRHTRLFFLILWVLAGIQVVQTLSWLELRWYDDPRQMASTWLEKNIRPNTELGVENIPIYQMLPDRSLKDLYEADYGVGMPLHRYVVVEGGTDVLPKYIILSNTQSLLYEKISPKKALLQRMSAEGYQPIVQFIPKRKLNTLFVQKRDIYFSGLSATPSDITVYSRNEL